VQLKPIAKAAPCSSVALQSHIPSCAVVGIGSEARQGSSCLKVWTCPGSGEFWGSRADWSDIFATESNSKPSLYPGYHHVYRSGSPRLFGKFVHGLLLNEIDSPVQSEYMHKTPFHLHLSLPMLFLHINYT